MTDKITFNDLGLPEFILKAVSDLGFETPSPIQQACIPALLEGRDVLGMAQTGSGKTAAFSLPILAKIDPAAKHPQLLVMAPTRELAIQVADACEHFMKYAKGINIVTLYGGQRYDIQLRALKQGAQVVVGTPGRILDHIRRNTLNLSELKAIVLDEADEMLRMAACMEEHFPHSMAKAVVDAALKKELDHEEMHSKVQYIVAHGISTTIEGKTAVIGSYHFVFEDENCKIPA